MYLFTQRGKYTNTFFLKKYFFLALSSDFTWSNSPCFKFSVKKLEENCQISTLRGEITKKNQGNLFCNYFSWKDKKKIKQLCKIFQTKLFLKKSSHFCLFYKKIPVCDPNNRPNSLKFGSLNNIALFSGSLFKFFLKFYHQISNFL